MRRCVDEAFDELRDAASYWNLNVPNVPLERIAGIAVTRLGRKRICGRMVGEEHGGATRYYRAWESPFETDRETVGTDIGAVHAGYASLTPLLLDRTAEAGLARALAHSPARDRRSAAAVREPGDRRNRRISVRTARSRATARRRIARSADRGAPR